MEVLMKRVIVVLFCASLGIGLGAAVPHQASKFSQNAATGETANGERATLVGLVRTINTAEASEFIQYGSYSSWQTLLAHDSYYLNSWLTRFYLQKGAHFAEAPEILPGWNLRLNVLPDGTGFVLVLEDANDKTGFAALNDERGIIRLCKYLQ
jgi:hypothetical protein